MMKPNALSSCLVLFGLMALSVISCKRNIVAKKMTQNMAAYVYAFTSGTISREQPVRIRFTSSLVKAEDVGKSVESGVFNITPSVPGAAIWEDAQTIRFTPEKNFASGAIPCRIC